VVVPAVRAGEEAAGRRVGDVALVCPVMTAVSDDDGVRERQREGIRARLAFYGSTPGYGVVFDASGWPGIGERLNALQRQGDLAALKDTITDEMLDAMAVTSTWDDLPRQLLDRYGDRADQIVCYSVLEHWADDPDSLGHWQDVNRRFVELRDVGAA
jgi:Luciferase-like monooxygenase